jgi:[protein-PII] uridylyltransferase
MELRDSVSRPDLLALGAMFHDIGKGYPGDHTDVGVAMFKVIGHRMGLTDEDTDTVILLIRNHLLLADVATRRDLSDDATITGVANELTTAGHVDLLRALTIADSLATGPSAWGTWKAGLVDELARRVKHFLGGGDITDVLWRLFPDAEVLEMMASGQVVARTTDDSITVVNPNAVGVLSSVAGVLSLAGLDVLGADVHADEQGMAASKFRVAIPSYGPVDWEPIVNNIYKAMDKKFALQARIAERERTYTRPRRRTAVVPAAPTVRFDDSASSRSTFIEVRATDRVGILFRITEAMVDLGLDIRHARVQTIGDEAVDTFYVRNRDGSLVTDIDHRKEIQRAILHAVTRAD